MSRDVRIPVIDLFAGPGGLGEGFSSFQTENQEHPFKIALSIEMNPEAHSTLCLRSFFRQFEKGKVPEEYYSLLRREIDTKALYCAFPEQAARASSEAWLAELGSVDPAAVDDRISRAKVDASTWVLMGGPPCQAYSIAGRSRNKGVRNYVPEKDPKQYLYREYLRVIATHWPAVFVMENVKGMLSARLDDKSVFQRIIENIKDPLAAIGGRPEPTAVSVQGHSYRVFSLSTRKLFESSDPMDYVVKCERSGVPQSRHRVILLGVRDDLGDVKPGTLAVSARIASKEVLAGLPRLRGGLSETTDSGDAWLNILDEVKQADWARSVSGESVLDVVRYMRIVLKKIRLPRADRGSEFVVCEPRADYAREWFLDDRLRGVCNHATRSHLKKDLHRYFYAACFARVRRRSPMLADFPRELLPEHRNVVEALDGSMFADRFRVQLGNSPATTVVSHIAKDGHYYIHYDPTQCRSLTVREAARLQTFPDNYLFLGPRTEQYRQVGNAVPPLLAKQIAGIVSALLSEAGEAE